MSKKLKNLTWESVALEGFPISTSNFDGFVGLEECTSYGLDKESKRPKKRKPEKKRKLPSETENKDAPNKKVKTNQKSEDVKSKKLRQIKTKPIELANGFIVETITNTTSPSQDNKVSTKPLETVEPKVERSKRNERKKKMKEKIKQMKAQKATQSSSNPEKTQSSSNPEKTQSSSNPEKTKKKPEKTKSKKPKLGEQDATKSDLTPEDMLTWAEFKLQEPIVTALMELGFDKPTKIQQLSLPAAIHGRRDILGAAETGCGKTLAFGLPILSGILKLKEKAETKDLDVYEIPYKKGPAKPKKVQEKPKENKRIKKNKKEGNENKEVKESSEDGYGSGNDSGESEEEKPVIKKNKFKKAEDYLKEYDVPIKKKDTSVDDESDDENYLHLSDMYDSDDLTDNSNEDTESVDDQEASDDDVQSDVDVESEDADESENDDIQSEDEDEQSENDVQSEDEDVQSDGVDSEGELSEDEILGDDGIDEMGSDEEVEDLGNPDETGIGCVKVVDNIEIPGHVVTKTGKPLYALILTPTRELAIQISRHLMAVAKYTGIKIATIVGGMAHVKQERVLRSGPEVVVATPGRLWELINQGQPHLQQLETVKFLAIDETDRMIERGHFDELTPLLERLNADEDRKAARQNFVFSATLTLVHDLPTHMKGKKVTKNGKIINRRIKKMTPEQKVKRLVDMLGMTEPKVVDITQKNLGTAESLTECKITCALEHKDAYLYYILKRHPGRTIVFCNSIGSVKRLATLLTILKCHPLPLHASMAQRQRLKNLERFRDDPHGVLIATDVAARGLDIPLVDHVVQYQCPRTAENYVHRSGRTARAHREGLNVLMVEPAEAYNYSKLCLTLNKTSEVPSFPVAEHLLAPLRALAGAARSLEALEARRRRAGLARGWRDRAAREMDILIDDDDVPTAQVDPALDKAIKARKKQLDIMLSKPVFPRGFSFKYPTLNDPMALSTPQENALEVMKKAMASGEQKKEKRKSKNAPLLKLSRGVHKDKKNKNKS